MHKPTFQDSDCQQLLGEFSLRVDPRTSGTAIHPVVLSGFRETRRMQLDLLSKS
ncbi:MAG: hypothetical protein PUP91_35315 [Rhizonema sp. PD37]|nr:hypothetical protein [Rhizonema sp. PD37]